jgi:hypothetical protein
MAEAAEATDARYFLRSPAATPSDTALGANASGEP